MDVSAIFLAFLKLLEIHAEQKIRERLYFVLRCVFFILLKTNKRYGVQVNHAATHARLSKSAAIPPEVQHQFLEKYKGSLILGSAYISIIGVST